MFAGVVLITGSVAAGLGPIGMVCGVLMLWSGIVKAIVLRIWHGTLGSDAASDEARVTIESGIAIRRRS
jgi:hypothetical protein